MKTSTRTIRRGFTLVELMLGLAITALVMAALAAFVGAVGQGWEGSDGTQDAALEARQAYVRVQNQLSSALYVGQVMAGSLDGSAATPGGVFYWAQDTNGDAGPQTGEMALIQHDPTTQTLWLYEFSPAGGGSSLTYANITNPATPVAFKALAAVNPP